jgi:competence protein ComEC
LSLAGDANHREWEWWLKSHPSLVREVQVHKASHHGSRNGDSGAAISRLKPKTVVVSVGAKNGYGHPHAEAMLLYANATVYRTDLHGTIVVEADRSGACTVHTRQAEAPRLPPAATAAPSRPALSNKTICIDINTANVQALVEIIHIGKERAQQIVALRRAQPFRSVQDLTRVDGIAAARVRDIIAEGKACVSP